LSEKYKGRAKFARVDIDQEPELVKGVNSVPCLALYSGGEKVNERPSQGQLTGDRVEAMLSGYV
jgi:thioredoxin-like negative regulator of GroEL